MAVVKICECGKSFGLEKDDKRVKLCLKCAKTKKYKRKFRRAKAKCKQCGEEFTKVKDHHYFCSDECRKKFHHNRYFDKAAKHLKTCPWCDEPFTTSDSRRVYCTDFCYSEAKRYRERHTAQKVSKLTKDAKKRSLQCVSKGLAD